MNKNEHLAKRIENFYLNEPFPLISTDSSILIQRPTHIKYQTKNIKVLSEEATKPNQQNYQDGTILIRLEHRCGPGSLFTECDPEEFNFEKYFGRKIEKIKEYNLLGNFPIENRKRLVFKTKQGKS